MASPYILDDEEEDFYDDEYGPFPEQLSDEDFWALAAPEEEAPRQQAWEIPAYVRQPGGGAQRFWQDEYGGAPDASEIARATQMSPYGVYTTPGGGLEPRIAFDPSKVLVPLSRLGVSAQEMMDALDYLGSASPDLTQEEAEELMLQTHRPDELAKASAGLTQGAWRTAEGLTSPINLGLMAGTAGLGQIPVAARALSGAFAADMAQHVPELAREAGEAYESGDTERFARALTELGATGAFTTMAGTHALAPRAPAATTGRPDAIQEPSATAFYGRLQEQPRINEGALSPEESAAGVPQRELPAPGDAGRPFSAEEARNRHLPLIEQAAARNAELGLPSGWRKAKPYETEGAGWIATVDEGGRTVINTDKLSTWLERLKPEDQPAAIQAIFSEEGIHGVARKTLTDESVGELWKSLTRAEQKLVEESYGKLDPQAIEQGVSPDVMYGHEYLRRQMQRMLREPVREKAEARGYDWLKESAIDAIERVILAGRRLFGSKASKNLDSMLNRMQEHIDAARKAKGLEPRNWAEALERGPATAPRATEKGAEAEQDRPPLIPALQGKSFTDTVAAYDAAPPDAGIGYKGKNGDGATGLAWDVGSMARTAEDVAALRKIAEDTPAKVKQLLADGDMDAAMQLAGKQPAEAYEFATGVNLAGTPKWETFEKRVPGYRPPVPDAKYLEAKGAPRAMEKEEPEFRPRRQGEHPADYDIARRRALEERGGQQEPYYGTADEFKDTIRAIRQQLAQNPSPARRESLTAQLAEAHASLRQAIGGAPRAMPRQQHQRRDVVTKVREFFGGLPGRLRVAPNRFAGREAPITYTASPESANKLVEYASGKVAAPEVARHLASEVLGDKWKDSDFGKKLGAVLVEDRLRAIRQERRRARDPNWRNVTTLIGKSDSPFATEAEFRRAVADPEIRAAIQRHKQTVQAVARGQHRLAGGQLSGHGLHTDAFVNLEALIEGAQPEHFGQGGRGNLSNPLRRKSRFSKRAKGEAQRYQLDYRQIAERMVEANFVEAAKRRAYGQLIQDGLAVMTNPGDPIPHGFDAHPQPITIERKGVPAGGGKARTFVKNLWVRKDIYPEVRQALDVDGRIGEAAIVNAFNGLNQIQLAGPTDAVWHIANMFGSIAGSQGGRTALIDFVRKVPGVNVLDTIGRTTASAIRVLRDNPATQKQIAQLAKIGAMRPLEGERPTPGLGLLRPANMIQLLDRAGRLVRDDLYQNLVRRGLLKDTPADRRLWVNQMGQYNARLMGGIQRWLKEQGVSPFVVAGTNFNRMAMRRMMLSQGLKAKNPAASAQMMATDLFGVLATLVVVPSVMNYFLTGNPSGRPGTKFGQIDTGEDTKDGKHLVIDPAQWVGMRRGLRITGAQGLIEGLREGQRGERIGKQIASDVIGGAIHPWTGPAVHGASVAATGYSPSGYKESENPKDYKANLLAALEQLNPVAKAIFEGHKEHRGIGAQVGLSLGGAAGVKAVRPLTAYDRMRNLHEKWLADNPDRKIRESFERNEAATWPLSQYRDMDHAIRNRDPELLGEAIKKVREVANDKDIVKRMFPVIGRMFSTDPRSRRQPKPLFHESAETEHKFRESLTDKEREVYDQAVEDRKADYQFFLEVWRERGPRPEVEEEAQP